MSSFVIGIAGGSGSGKSTLAEALAERLGESCVLIRHDSYYRSTEGFTPEERVLINYDAPEAYETELLIRHLDELRAGRAVNCPVYDFSRHNRSSESVVLKPAPIIIVEGILVLAEEELRKSMDLRVFVDAPDDVRLSRRIRRDIVERGRSAESVLNQYERTVKPMYELFVEPSKKNADIIVPGGGMNKAVLALLGEYLYAWAAAEGEKKEE